MIRSLSTLAKWWIAWLWLAVTMGAGATAANRAPLDPRGEIHIPIGIANTLDSLKTFVEAEGVFSPGVGSYGVYFWVYDNAQNRLFAPTMDNVACKHGLTRDGYLIPWSQWRAGAIAVHSQVAHVQYVSPQGQVHVVGARVTLTNTTDTTVNTTLYAALRPVGPAGYDVRKLSVDPGGRARLTDGRAALLARQRADRTGVSATDTIGQFAMRAALPERSLATSPGGDCSGALWFDVELAPGRSKTFDFVCPVLPGRRAVRHQPTWRIRACCAGFVEAEGDRRRRAGRKGRQGALLDVGNKRSTHSVWPISKEERHENPFAEYPVPCRPDIIHSVDSCGSGRSTGRVAVARRSTGRQGHGGR